MTAPGTDQADEPAGIEPPPPGVAVLACACGAVLDSADMHRAGTGLTSGDAPDCLTIRRITCRSCA